MRGIFRRRAAILGGAFDPVHCGHLALARRAARDLPVSAVRLVPNGAPPHRPAAKLSWEKRVRLCELAAARLPRVAVGREEPPGQIRRTVDTVRRHRLRHRRVLLIMGADAFAEFHRWRGWRRILRMANIAVARRDGGGDARAVVRSAARTVKNPRLLADGAGRVFMWRFRPGKISSTAIRARE